MGKIDLEEQEFWDHYSDLPNPSWYQYKKEITDEEDLNSSIPINGTDTETKTQEKEYMGSVTTNSHG